MLLFMDEISEAQIKCLSKLRVVNMGDFEGHRSDSKAGSTV